MRKGKACGRMAVWICSAMLLVTTVHAGAARADWNPERFADEETLELMTVDPDEGDHWFPVWLVVLDGDVYVRLGSRAAGRIERNSRNPLVSVRVAGEEFPEVRTEAAPEMTERVAEAMAEKYWSDVFIRFFSHPLTLRLVPGIPATRQANLVGR